MFNLFYPNGDGTDRLIGQFASYDLCATQALSDNQANYSITYVDSDGNITMSMSC